MSDFYMQDEFFTVFCSLSTARGIKPLFFWVRKYCVCQAWHHKYA